MCGSWLAPFLCMLVLAGKAGSGVPAGVSFASCKRLAYADAVGTINILPLGGLSARRKGSSGKVGQVLAFDCRKRFK